MVKTPRKLTEEEAKMYNEIKADYEKTGECPHLCINISFGDIPMFHGCIVCGMQYVSSSKIEIEVVIII